MNARLALDIILQTVLDRSQTGFGAFSKNYWPLVFPNHLFPQRIDYYGDQLDDYLTAMTRLDQAARAYLATRIDSI